MFDSSFFVECSANNNNSNNCFIIPYPKTHQKKIVFISHDSDDMRQADIQLQLYDDSMGLVIRGIIYQGKRYFFDRDDIQFTNHVSLRDYVLRTDDWFMSLRDLSLTHDIPVFPIPISIGWDGAHFDRRGSNSENHYVKCLLPNFIGAPVIDTHISFFLNNVPGASIIQHYFPDNDDFLLARCVLFGFIFVCISHCD